MQFAIPSMTKSARDSTRPPLTTRGTPYKRPPETGKPVVVRMQSGMIARLQLWIDAQRDEHLTQPEAIRRILDQVLPGGGKDRK
jgi:hypothetical protein